MNTIDQHVWVPGVVTMASDPRPADQLVRGRCKPHGTFPRGETFARSAARYVAWLRFFRHFGGVIAPKTCSLGFLNDESFSKPQIDRNKNIIYTILEASGNNFSTLFHIFRWVDSKARTSNVSVFFRTIRMYMFMYYASKTRTFFLHNIWSHTYVFIVRIPSIIYIYAIYMHIIMWQAIAHIELCTFNMMHLIILYI